jgi:hypothetical protein
MSADKTVGGRTREEQAAWLARNMAEVADETLTSEGDPAAYEREMTLLRIRFERALLSFAFPHSPGLRDGLERAAKLRPCNGKNHPAGSQYDYHVCGRADAQDRLLGELRATAIRAEASKLDGDGHKATCQLRDEFTMAGTSCTCAPEPTR